MKPRIRQYRCEDGSLGWLCGLGEDGLFGSTPLAAFRAWVAYTGTGRCRG